MSIVAKGDTIRLTLSVNHEALDEKRRIKNKTHGLDYDTWVEWIKEFDITTKVYTNPDGTVVFKVGGELVNDDNKVGKHVFVIGETYKVTFDKEEYFCEAFGAMEENTQKCIAVGDATIAKNKNYDGGDSNGRFFFMDKNGTGNTWELYTTRAGMHHLSVSRAGVRTIDPNFIEDEQRADKLPTFDISVQNPNGNTKTYRMYGYEVKE